MGVSLDILIFPPGQSRHEKELDQVVPKEEADDFFRWLPLSAIFRQEWEIESEKFDEGKPRNSQHRRRGPFGSYW